MKKLKKFLVRFFALLILAAGGGAYWLHTQLQPPYPNDKPRFVRFNKSTGVISTLKRLEDGKIVKNAFAARLYVRWKKLPQTVKEGTYELGGNQTLDQVFEALKQPIIRKFRFPETNWANRSANLLEKDQISKAADYMALVKQPEKFKNDVSFPLPKESLEGYLYPDTYHLTPLTSTREVIDLQLTNFQRRIWQGLDKPKNLHRAIIIASMVELEVARDDERAMVAGVIENRLARNMPLQIDAAINYGLQEWRTLTYADYRNVDSPYNLYRNRGLPPGPICSPTIKSIRAALKPAKHNYLYYVALPSGRSLFATDLATHNRNVAQRRAAIARGTPE